MNENIAAFLRVDHAQLTKFGPIMPRNMQQSPVADLAAHLRVERRAINNDIQFVQFFTRKNCFNDCFCLKKIVSQEFGRLDFELAFFDTDFFLLLCLSSAFALLLHQFLKANYIDSEAALTCHEFGQI